MCIRDRTLRAHTHANAHLQHVYDTVGLEALEFSVLEAVALADQLHEREHYWVQRLRSAVQDGGFNIRPDATHPWIAPRETSLAWKLKDTMDTHKVTRYALQKASGVAMNTLRSMYDGETRRPDLDVLDTIIRELRGITGADITLADVLEWSGPA